MNNQTDASHFFSIILSGNLSSIQNYFNSNPTFNPNTTDFSNQTSLFFLFLSPKQNINYFEIMEFLLSKGTDPSIIDTNNQTVLFYSAAAGDVKCTQYLLEHYFFDTHFMDKHGQTPLYYAVEHSHLDVIDLLLNKGFDINHVDNNGENCLFMLHKDAQENVLKFLMKRGVDINVQSKEKGTIKTFYIHKGLFKLVDIIEGINDDNDDMYEDKITCMLVLDNMKPLVKEDFIDFIHEHNDIYKELMQYQDDIKQTNIVNHNEKSLCSQEDDFLLDINKTS